jgi:hypothetical protein
MKLKIFILFVIFMTVLGFNYSLSDGNDSSTTVLLKNIEALAQENIEYTRYLSMEPVNRTKSTSMPSSAGSYIVSVPYTIDCCCPATYMEGCDLNAQDSDC